MATELLGINKQMTIDHNNFIHNITKATCVDRDSAIRTATRYGLDGLGIESRWGARFSAPPDPPLGPTQPLVKWAPRTASFPGVNWPGRDADNTPNLAPKLKKEYSYTFTPPVGLCGLF